MQDWYDALAYSLYLINQGRIGSRAEREYIDAERAARQYRRLASCIKDFKFEEGEEEGCVADDEITTASINNNNYAINGAGENSIDCENGLNDKLLTSSQRASVASS